MAKTTPPDPPCESSSLSRTRSRTEIVHSLEEGDIGLNESLKHYEEGIKLLRQSYDLLQQARAADRAAQRRLISEGNPIAQPFDNSATIDQAEPGKRRQAHQ